MTRSVPRRSPHVLASAGVGHLCRHVDGVRYGLDGHDELCGNDKLVPSLHVLFGEECEPVVAAPDVFHCAKSGHKGVRHAAQFQQILRLDHGFLRMRPRADRALVALLRHYASGSIYGYPTRQPLDLTKVNVAEQFARIAP